MPRTSSMVHAVAWWSHMRHLMATYRRDARVAPSQPSFSSSHVVASAVVTGGGPERVKVAGRRVSGMGSGETPGAGLGAWARETAAALVVAPRALTVAAGLVTAEGVLLVGLGAFQVVRGFGGGIDDLARAEFGGVL